MPVFAVGVMDADRMARHPYRFSITTIFDMEDAMKTARALGLPLVQTIGRLVAVVNWPMLGVAAILGVLAYIVRSGEGLQRETEGLV
ncbi:MULTISPECIES: hypothetical protein [Microbacterium]|uniref:hypothetical protein n=1 Tax=Microbacterium sp. TaxID=51671 RepID=UPI0019A0BFAC|nr:hypothetical protein [Microbacterium sp.]MBD3758667.1 hypothetical protein [Microbacterium sp.]